MVKTEYKLVNSQQNAEYTFFSKGGNNDWIVKLNANGIELNPKFTPKENATEFLEIISQHLESTYGAEIKRLEAELAELKEKQKEQKEQKV